MKRKILRSMKKGIILEKKIPDKADKQVAMIEYQGFTALVPVDSLWDGSYRTEFIRQTGVPLPATTKVPWNPPEYFCPNLHDIWNIQI